MARVTYVKKAQESKNVRRCRTCGNEIKVGESYKWFASRIGRSARRSDYHATCAIPRSHMTSSQHLATLYDAVDAAEQEINDWDGEDGTTDELEAILTTCSEGVTEAAEGYRESQENMEEGFGHATSNSDELGEKADELETFADSLSSWSGDPFDAEAAREEAEAEAEAEEMKGDKERIAELVEDARVEWADQQRESASDVLSENPY